jgi:ATP-dependent Clp protease adaptor protein ClpS
MTTDIQERVEEEIKITEPKMWHVIFHNDDKTTMEFVIFLLMQVFHKSVEESTEIMLAIHTKDSASAGLFSHEVAESKMNVCVNTAREHGFPLQVTIEEEK